MYVPFNLEHYAERILPVAGVGMQALCTGNKGGIRARAIVDQPVVDDCATQTGCCVRFCYGWLVRTWSNGSVEQEQVAEVELLALHQCRAGSDLEIGHGSAVWALRRWKALWDIEAVCEIRKVNCNMYL